MIGQLVDESGLSGSEEDEAASFSSDTSRPTDAMNIVRRRRRRRVLKTHKVTLLSRGHAHTESDTLIGWKVT